MSQPSPASAATYGADEATAAAQHESRPVAHPGLHVGEVLVQRGDVRVRVGLLLLDPAGALQGEAAPAASEGDASAISAGSAAEVNGP